jgi:protein MAK16
VTGLCNRNSCPLSNSRYATVYESKGICYLKIKTPERAHTPKLLWESIKLDPSYNKALEQIEKELEFFPKFLKHKCKQRFTRLRQVLVKSRKMKLEGSEEYQIVSRKAEKREKSRLVKAEKSAVIESHIAQELLKNLKEGKYDDIYNINKNIRDKIMEKETIVDEGIKEEDYDENDFDKGYIEDFSEDDYENEEEEFDEEEEDKNEVDEIFKKEDKKEDKKDKTLGKKTKRNKKNIEYENEYENVEKIKNVNLNYDDDDF